MNGHTLMITKKVRLVQSVFIDWDTTQSSIGTPLSDKYLIDFVYLFDGIGKFRRIGFGIKWGGYLWQILRILWQERLSHLIFKAIWGCRRTFQEKISGTIKSGSRTEFKSLLNYIDKTQVQVVMVSEISRPGRRVVGVLNFVELLHEKGIALYIQQFNMLSMESGKENPVAKMLLQML